MIGPLQAQLGLPEACRGINQPRRKWWTLSAQLRFFQCKLPSPALYPMAGYHHYRVPGRPLKTRDQGGMRLVDINDVVRFSQTSGSNSVATHKNRECKSCQTPVQRSRNILGAEVFHRMSCKNELIMDEAHDP